VHRSTVDRILKVFLNTGCVLKKVYPKEAAFEKITPVCALFILNLVICNPAIVEEFLLLVFIYQPLAGFCHQMDSQDRSYAMLHYKRMHLTEHSMYLMF